jgi:hypothetical protein
VTDDDRSDDAVQEVDPRPEVGPAVVTALYLALLGREPDPEGLQFWRTAGSAEEVIGALTDTEEHKQRLVVLAQAVADSRPADTSAVAAVRLEVGNGMVALDAREIAVEALSTLPWEDLAADPRAAVLVLGPYARQFTDELGRRSAGVEAHAGLAAVLPALAAMQEPVAGRRTGTLVLTDEEYLPALVRLRPDVLVGRVLTLMHPLTIAAGTPADEAAIAVRTARLRLHALGYVEVSRVFSRRYGGGVVVLDRTYTSPDERGPYEAVEASAATAQQSRSVWMIGRRIPVGDRV